MLPEKTWHGPEPPLGALGLATERFRCPGGSIESLLDDLAEPCSPASGAAEARLFGRRISLYLYCKKTGVT